MFKIGVLAAVCWSLFLSGCATAPAVTKEDPWENVNRSIFKFNDALDTWVAKPVAKGYVAVTPNFVEAGIGNFFDNAAEVPNILNNLLQAKWKQAGYDSSRFLLNTFAGLGGFVDVAQDVGLPKNQREDFGQTLRVWGIPQGPYIVLPILGPTTLVDLAGRPVDWWTTPTTYIPTDSIRNRLTVLDFTHARAGLLDVEELVSGDKYLFFRESYLQNRTFLENDGVVEDNFGGDLDDFDDF